MPIFITVEDQVPVASNSDQEISVGDISNAQYDKASGKLIWKFMLNAGETKVIKLGYSTKYPKTLRPRKKKYRTISSPSF